MGLRVLVLGGAAGCGVRSCAAGPTVSVDRRFFAAKVSVKFLANNQQVVHEHDLALSESVREELIHPKLIAKMILVLNREQHTCLIK
jgi:hypothetical protein